MRRKALKLAAMALGIPPLYVAGLWVFGPEVSLLAREMPAQTRYMRLRAEALGLPPDTFKVQPVGLEEFSPLFVCSVLKAEDPRFFRHHGVEWAALRNATVAWLRGNVRRGGSTVTQQLARNLYLSPERTVHRKLREVVIARQLEATLPKQRILELYLNTVEWGEGVWGAAQASQHYFARRPAELGAFESSFLAGLLAAPRHRLEGSNAARMRAVQLRVLKQLRRSSLLDEQEYAHAQLQVDRLYSMLEQGAKPEEALAAAVRMPAPAPSAHPTLTGGLGLQQQCELPASAAL